MWISGYNRPGYLPEDDPVEFDTQEEARSAIADLLIQFAVGESFEGEKEAADSLNEAAKLIAKEYGEFSVTINGWAYWVTKEV